MSTEFEQVEQLPAALVVRERSSVLLAPVMDVNTAMARLQEFQAFIASYLKEGIDEDYGVIPGTRKKTLLKPGADKLAEVYGLADEYVIMSEVEHWDTGLFDYKVKCILKSRRDDSVVGEGLGSCSSFESKYRWRDSQRKCPACTKETIIKGKADFGGGWLCWTKKGGCGAKFKDGDPAIEKQIIGRVENPDIVDTKNTVLKMAKKRAKIDAIIGVTRSSGIFTQDFEDLPAQGPPPPATTTEDIPLDIGGTGKGPAAESLPPNAAKPTGASAVAPASERKTRARKAPSAAPAPDAPELCTLEQQDYLRLKFKDLLPAAMREKADEFRRDWLKSRGYKKPGPNGTEVGTSTTIPRELFQETCREALQWARELAKQ